MIIRQIWTGNAYRNFNYLIACGETGEALAIDPLDHERCYTTARSEGWTITTIVNTHEHHDHIDGNGALAERTGAKILAHAGAGAAIPNVARGLVAGDLIRIGRTVELEVLDTPGHTMCHVCLRSHGDQTSLFCGDTLFNAGAGNCHHGGHPATLYETFSRQLAGLPDDTQIYPGHDYIENNLRVTLDREPGNAAAGSLLEAVSGQDPAAARVTTIALEREINTFFRLNSAQVIERLRDAFPDLPDQPDQQTVFLKLRELRNRW